MKVSKFHILLVKYEIWDILSSLLAIQIRDIFRVNDKPSYKYKIFISSSDIHEILH